MKNFIALAGAVACLSGGLVTESQASYFSWGDERLGINLTFPDSWKVVINQDADDVLRIAAPEANGSVVCEFKMREDNRYRVYPQRYEEAISDISYGQEFWDLYMAKHDRVKFHFVQEDGAYGGGHGSYALASYTTGYPEVFEQRASLMFVGFYNANVHIAECSSPILSFDKWRRSFYSIIGSVEFRKDYDELITGYYENFLEDKHKTFTFQNAVTGETTQY